MKWVDGVSGEPGPDGAYYGNNDQVAKNAQLRNAVINGTPFEVRNCIDQGAQVVVPQIADNSTQTAEPLLHLATALNRSHTAEVLAGGDPKCVRETDFHERTALHVAALKGFDGMAHTLLQMGVDPYTEDTYGLTAMDLAQARGHDHVLQVLESNGVKFELKQDVEELRAMVDAAYPPSQSVGREQIRHGSDPQHVPFPGIPIR